MKKENDKLTSKENSSKFVTDNGVSDYTHEYFNEPHREETSSEEYIISENSKENNSNGKNMSESKNKKEHSRINQKEENHNLSYEIENHKRFVFKREILLIFLIIFSFLTVHFFKQFTSNQDFVQKRTLKLQKFTEIAKKEQLCNLFDDDWLLIIELEGEKFLNILPLLYHVNVARIILKDFQSLLVLENLFGKNIKVLLKKLKTKKSVLISIKNSALIDTKNKIMSVIDLKRKIDIMNMIDLVIFLYFRKLRIFIKKIFF